MPAQPHVDVDEVARRQGRVARVGVAHRRSKRPEVDDGVHVVLPGEAEVAVPHPAMNLLLHLLLSDARTQDALDSLEELLRGGDGGVDRFDLVGQLASADLARQPARGDEPLRVRGALEHRLQHSIHAVGDAVRGVVVFAPRDADLLGPPLVEQLDELLSRRCDVTANLGPDACVLDVTGVAAADDRDSAAVAVQQEGARPRDGGPDQVLERILPVARLTGERDDPTIEPMLRHERGRLLQFRFADLRGHAPTKANAGRERSRLPACRSRACGGSASTTRTAVAQGSRWS